MQTFDNGIFGNKLKQNFNQKCKHENVFENVVCEMPANSFRSLSVLTHFFRYSQVSNIRLTLVGNKIVDHSDVVEASPVGAAPTTSSFST